MSEFEQFFPNETSQYGDGLMLQKHGDNYSIVSARKSTKSEGTVFMDWAFPQDKDRKPREKAIPLGVKLGNHKQAMSLLLQMVSALGGTQAHPKPIHPIPAKSDDIQF